MTDATATRLTAKQRKFVAAYIGIADGNATEAARLSGYAGNYNTVATVGWQNLQKPLIAAAINEELSKVERYGIAVKERRIAAKVERWRALHQIRRARTSAFLEQIDADAPLPEHRRRALPPGWETGLLVRSVKAVPIGSGRNEIIEEWSIDATMVKELDALEKDIAAELDDPKISGTINVNHKHSGVIDHAHHDLSHLSDEQIERAIEARRMYDEAVAPGKPDGPA